MKLHLSFAAPPQFVKTSRRRERQADCCVLHRFAIALIPPARSAGCHARSCVGPAARVFMHEPLLHPCYVY